MATNRRKTIVTRKQGIVVVEPRSVQTAPRSGKVKRRRGGGGSRSVGYRAAKKNEMIGVAIGGLVYGFLEKSFPTMPTLPLVGKSGTVALACYFLGGNNKIINDVGIAAAAIAGYSLGKEGKISGYEDDGGFAVT